MKEVDVGQAALPLSEYALNLGREPILLTNEGKPIAALVPIENADMETVRLSTHPQFLALIERSRARYEAEGGISPEEMRRRLGIDPGEQETPA